MIRLKEMKAKEHIRAGSFDWAVVREALRRSMPPVAKPSGKPGKPSTSRDLDISVLLNEVFGGEILRTHKGRGWHFYNRINDECVDLDVQEGDDYAFGKSSDTSEDTTGIYEQNDYTTFFLRFVTALEEAVGLGKYRPA